MEDSKIKYCFALQEKTGFNRIFLSFIVFLNLKTKDSAKINKSCLKLSSKVKINQKNMKKRIFHTFQMKQPAFKRQTIGLYHPLDSITSIRCCVS